MSFGSGIGVGRGRGFKTMATMAQDLPKPGANFGSSTTNGTSAPVADFADDDWDEGGTTTTSNNNASSGGWQPKANTTSNGYSGGGGSSWSGGNSGGGSSWSGGASGGGGGGGGDRNCYKCNKPGHISKDCPDAANSGPTKCFNCQQEGHMSRECTNEKVTRGRECRTCGQEGHMSRDCPDGGEKKKMECFKCHQEGHMSRECPNADSDRPKGCYKCKEEGHMSRECPNAPAGGDDRPKTCFKCHEEGHMSRECPSNPDGGERSTACFKCKEEGHFASDCPNPDANPDGKPKASTYVPPELSENADELFDNITAGINFAKYDEIEVKLSGSGSDQVKPITTFAEGVRAHLVKNIERHKYTKPTPVQKWCIPIVAAKRDLMACAQTGSGKTAAFLLPMIQAMLESPPSAGDGSSIEPLALIVAPTRELATQIQAEAAKFTFDSFLKSVVLYGGTSVSTQAQRLRRGAQIIVGTPGRLLMFLNDGSISLTQLKYFVLDEADRLLDMGFKSDIEKMVNHPTMPPKENRQTLMFSATFPDEVQNLAREFLGDYLFLTVGIVGAANSDVTQVFMEVAKFDKKQALKDIITEHGMERTLVFVETKRNTDYVATFLCQNELPATSIHGDREQQEREQALSDFKSGRIPILMATAVAARGLDIRDVRHVINFDLPKTIDEYVHRIGRTGRVGNTGKATSFYDPDNDSPLAGELVRILAGAHQEVPDWLAQQGGSGGGGGYGGNRFGSRDTRQGQTTATNDTWNTNSAPSAVAEEEWD